MADKPVQVEVPKSMPNTSQKTSPVQSPQPCAAHAQQAPLVIGEFTGRIKRPANAERFKGKALFVLVVCRGKELKRLQQCVADHGWMSQDLDIFVHKNDWDPSVKQLWPDDKVKVKLAAPCEEHRRL